MKLLNNNPKTASIFLGVLFTLGFAPFSLWALAIVVLALMLNIIRQTATLKQAFGYGFLFAMSHYISSIHWLVMAFYMDFKSWQMALAGGIPAVLALSFYLSIFMAVCFWIYKLCLIYFSKSALLKTLGDWLIPLFFATVWLGGEILRSIGDIAFPWNLTGYIFADNLTLMQAAFYIKIWGLSFIAVLTAGLLAQQNRQKIAALLIIGLLFSFGTWRLSVEENSQNKILDAKNNNANLSIRIVQPNINQLEKWDKYKRFDHINSMLELSFNQSTPNANITIWPETAVTIFATENPYFLRRLTENLEKNQLLITGMPRREFNNNNLNPTSPLQAEEEYSYYNSIITLDNKGNVKNIYDKHVLVPFGEYVPFRNILPSFIKKMVHGRADYIAGKEEVSLKLHNLKALPLICFEAILPFFVKDNINDKDFILILTNDGWFDGTIAPYQHFAMARMRAVEAGIPLIRVANTGISAFVAKNGKIIKRINMQQKGYVQHDLSPLLTP